MAMNMLNLPVIYSLPNNRYKSPLTAEEVTTIDALKSLSDQIEKLVSLLEISPTDIEDRKGIMAEMRETLRKCYPDCLLLQFGSTLSGFGVRYSDLDLLFLPFPGYCNTDFSHIDAATVEVPDPATIIAGTTPKDVLTKLPEYHHLKFIRNLMKTEKKLVRKVHLNAFKTPGLRMHIAAKKVIVDLSASNRLVVYSAELLQLYEKLDPRVKPLIITVRIWAQNLGFVRNNIFSTYAVALMVIFFLQNTSPPILPAVRRLIEMSGFNRMVAGWQTAFISDVSLIPKSKNTKPVSELLLEFFKFYWNFDFSQYAVSPHSGKVLPLKDVKELKLLADFEVSSINVQDPFLLSRNVCSRDGSYSNLKMALYIAYQMLQDTTGLFKFSSIFNRDLYIRLYSLQFGKMIYPYQKPIFINLDYDSFAHSVRSMKNLQSFHEKTCQAVFDILQFALFMECEVTDKYTANQKKAADANQVKTMVLNDISEQNKKNTAFELEPLLSLQCVVYSRVWGGRKKLTGKENESGFEEIQNPILREEYNISQSLIKNDPNIDSPRPIMCIKLDFYKHTCPQISDVVIVVRPLTSSNQFNQLAGFLQSYLPKTVRKMLSQK